MNLRNGRTGRSRRKTIQKFQWLPPHAADPSPNLVSGILQIEVWGGQNHFKLSSGRSWRVIGSLCRSKVRKMRLHAISVSPLGFLLDSQWGPKSFKNRLQRCPKRRLEESLENASGKGAILGSVICLECVRGLQNQGFEVFQKSLKTEPNMTPF